MRGAGALIEERGDAAYEFARSRRIAARQQKDSVEHRFWCAVARAVADRTGHAIGVDTATRYTNDSDEGGRFRTDDGETDSGKTTGIQ